MRDVRFAWPAPDGTVCVTQLGEAALAFPGDDDAKIMRTMAVMQAKGSMPKNTQALKIAKEDIPDKRYRQAWRIRNGKIVVDEAQKAEIDKAGV